MQIGTYECDAYEEGIINKWELAVKDSNGQFVVTSPKHHKKKMGSFTGGNLSSLLLDADKALIKLEEHRVNKPAVAIPPPPNITTLQPPAKVLTNLKQNIVEAAGSEPADILSNVVLDDSGGKTTKPPKPKAPPRDPAKLKFLQAFKLWLTYPDADPRVITKKLRDQGIEASDASTSMLRHMAANVVRAAIEIGFIMPQELKERRETRLKAENDQKKS